MRTSTARVRIAHHEARRPRSDRRRPRTRTRSPSRPGAARAGDPRRRARRPRRRPDRCAPWIQKRGRRPEWERRARARQRAPVAGAPTGGFVRPLDPTPLASRRMRATVWPSGVVTTKSSLERRVAPREVTRRSPRCRGERTGDPRHRTRGSTARGGRGAATGGTVAHARGERDGAAQTTKARRARATCALTARAGGRFRAAPRCRAWS